MISLMRNLIFAALLAVCAPAFAQMGQGYTPPAPPPAYGGNFLPQGQSVLFAPGTSFGGSTAVGGAVKTVAVVCFSSNTAFCPSGVGGQATNALSLPAAYNFTATETVTVTQGGQKITFGSAVCNDVMAGSQISIPGLGPNGATYVGHIVGCNGSQPSTVLTVDTPVVTAATGASLSVSFGTQFPAGITQIMVQGWAGGGGLDGAAVTVSAYNSASNVTLSTNSGGVYVNRAETLIMAPADDSVALSNACAAAMGTPQRTLFVQGQFYVPNVSDTCYQVILQAVDNTAAIYTGAGWVSNNVANTTASAGAHKEILIPPASLGPIAAQRGVVASRDFPVTKAAQPAVVKVNIGDSLATTMPNGLNSTGTYPRGFDKAFARDNPIADYTVNDCGVGGITVALLDGNPAATGGCWTSTSTSYVTQLAAFSPAPELVELGIGNNDGGALNLSSFTDLVWRIWKNQAAQFTAAPDMFLSSHHPYVRSSNGYNGTVSNEWQMYGAGWMRSFADVWGMRYVDGSGEGVKHVWGWDLRKPALFRNPTMPYGANATNMPIRADNSTHGGYSIGLTSSDAGSTFWGRMTGNSGITDTRGPFIVFVVGAAAQTQTFDDLLWVFYNTSTHVLSYECDPDKWHPGMGCMNMATGVPPAYPSLTGSITVATTGGNTTVTSTSAIFQGCPPGGTAAIPLAGPTHTVPGFGAFSYTEPLIGAVTCTSNTSITVAGTASNTYSGTTGNVMFGNPVVSTGITDTALTNTYTGGTTELLQIDLAGDYVRVWSQQAQNAIYSGPIMRPDGAEFVPVVWSGGNGPSITISADANGGTTYQTGDYQRNLPDFLEREVVGPSGTGPMSYGGIYGGPCGGDGNNHNCQNYGASVIDPLYGVDDMGLNGGGVQSVTSGASATVSSCLVGTVNVNDTTAPTITLPAYCANQIVIQDVGGNAGAHTITVAAPSGLTLSGTATITSNYGRRTVIWNSPTTATIQ